MKQLFECNAEELREIFENNGMLQLDTFDKMMEDGHRWNCEEYLPCWTSGIDYEIGYDRGAFFRCVDVIGFIEGLEKAQKSFSFLSDDYNEKIEYVRSLIVRKDNIVFWDYDNLNRLDARIDELCEELADACFSRFMAEYEACFEFENQLEYFVEFYCENFSECYIDENYIMYEDV